MKSRRECNRVIFEALRRRRDALSFGFEEEAEAASTVIREAEAERAAAKAATIANAVWITPEQRHELNLAEGACRWAMKPVDADTKRTAYLAELESVRARVLGDLYRPGLPIKVRTRPAASRRYTLR